MIRTFPREVRDRLEKVPYVLQAGESPGMLFPRPMPFVAPGASVLRLHSGDGQFRAFYFTASAQGILVFHAFAKKTRQTPTVEIQTGRRRLKEVPDEQE